MTPTEALRQCRATLSLIDRADCKDDAVWQKVVDTQAEVDRVLRDGGKPISVPQPVYQVQSPEAPDSSLWHDVDVRAFQRANKNGFDVRIMYAAAPAPAQQVVAVPEAIAKRTDEIRQTMANPTGIGRATLIGYAESLLAHIAFTNTPQPAAAPSGDVERDKLTKALKAARAALKTADYVIKGREHTDFIDTTIAIIDAATKE